MRQIGFQTPWIYLEEPPELREIYFRYGQPETVRRGTLLQNGGENTKRYYVLKGLATHGLSVATGKNWTPLLAIPGRAISDIDGFTQDLLNMPSYVIRDSTLLSLDDDRWERYVLNDHERFKLFAHYMILKMESITEAMILNYSLPAEDRLKAFLKSLLYNYNALSEGWNKVPLMLSNKEYAAFTGSTSISVSRYFTMWREAGLIKKSRSRNILIHSDLFSDLYDWVDEEYGSNYRYEINSRFLRK
jgi:hypothetical protein